MKQTAKNIGSFLSVVLFSMTSLLAIEAPQKEAMSPPWFQGCSLDVGLQAARACFKTPPTYSGMLGALYAKLTYQQPGSFFAQLRVSHGQSQLSSSTNKLRDYDSYGELVGGYCFVPCEAWTLTPYLGLGFDQLRDDHTSYASVAAIRLGYETLYAIIGAGVLYTQDLWSFGAELEARPSLRQSLRIQGLPGVAWTMKPTMGLSARLPVSYRLNETMRVELAPYYNRLVIGESASLSLPQRTLDQYGASLAIGWDL